MICSWPIDGVRDVVAQAPADAVAGAGGGEIGHRAGVEGVLAVDEFRVQDAVALVQRVGLEVGQAFPGHEVLGAGDAAAGDGGGEIAGPGVIVPLGAEQAVNPAVLVADEAHVIDIGFLRLEVRQAHRVIPELEPVHAGLAFGDGEEGFAVPAFDARHQDNVALPFHRADVEDAVDAQPRHQMRIGGVVEVVAPGQRRVLGGQDREFVAVEDAVAVLLFAVWALQQLPVLLLAVASVSGRSSFYS